MMGRHAQCKGLNVNVIDAPLYLIHFIAGNFLPD